MLSSIKSNLVKALIIAADLSCGWYTCKDSKFQHHSCHLIMAKSLWLRLPHFTGYLWKRIQVDFPPSRGIFRNWFGCALPYSMLFPYIFCFVIVHLCSIANNEFACLFIGTDWSLYHFCAQAMMQILFEVFGGEGIITATFILFECTNITDKVSRL